jgi:predicted MFS family arabinose efflux permease
MRPENPPAGRPVRLMMAVLLTAQIMVNMDSSIVTVATRTIQDTLHASDAELQLILFAYILVFGSLVITGARLGADFGYRRIFIIGLAGFTVSSLLCGLAPAAPALVLARALQGGCGAMLVPQVLSLIQITFSGNTRARAISIYTMILAVGVAAGQIIGGAIITANILGVAWRAAFLVNVPVGIVILILARRLPLGAGAGRVKLDLAGVALLAAAMSAVVVPLAFGRQEDWPIWALAAVSIGACGLAVFFLLEHRISRSGGAPVLEVDALRPAGVKPGLLACCLANFAFYGVVFPTTLHLQAGLGYTPLDAGLMFVPFPLGFAVVSLTWSYAPKPMQPLLPMLGMLLFSGALGALALVVRTGWPLAWVILMFIVAGAAMAAVFSTLIAQVAAAVGPRYAAALSGMIETGTLLASVVSITVVGGVYFSLTGVGRSGTGLAAAYGVDACLLLLGVWLAARTWQAARRSTSAASTDVLHKG